jgi:hypothetical protein
MEMKKKMKQYMKHFVVRRITNCTACGKKIQKRTKCSCCEMRERREANEMLQNMAAEAVQRVLNEGSHSECGESTVNPRFHHDAALQHNDQVDLMLHINVEDPCEDSPEETQTLELCTSDHSTSEHLETPPEENNRSLECLTRSDLIDTINIQRKLLEEKDLVIQRLQQQIKTLNYRPESFCNPSSRVQKCRHKQKIQKLLQDLVTKHCGEKWELLFQSFNDTQVLQMFSSRPKLREKLEEEIATQITKGIDEFTVSEIVDRGMKLPLWAAFLALS